MDDDTTVAGRGCAQLRVGRGDGPDTLVRPRAVVVAAKLAEGSPQAALRQEDEVVEQLAAQGTDEALAAAVGLRSPIGRWNTADVHGVAEPQIEGAATAVLASSTELAVDAVVVVGGERATEPKRASPGQVSTERTTKLLRTGPRGQPILAGLNPHLGAERIMDVQEGTG